MGGTTRSQGDPPWVLGPKPALPDLGAAEGKDFKALTSALSSRFSNENRSEFSA